MRRQGRDPPLHSIGLRLAVLALTFAMAAPQGLVEALPIGAGASQTQGPSEPVLEASPPSPTFGPLPRLSAAPDSDEFPLEGDSRASHPEAVGFVENLGQLGDRSIRFYAPAGHTGFAVDGLEWRPPAADRGLEPPVVGPPGSAAPGSVKLRALGASPSAPRGIDDAGFPSNFFFGNDPSRWVAGARSFREVRYEGLYPGMDLAYRASGSGVKYEWRLSPGVDPAAIEMRYEGAQSVRLDERGGLEVSTPWGALLEDAPASYQGAAPVSCHFIVKGQTSFGFACPQRNPVLPLVIDPYVYSTYFGGCQSDRPAGAAADGNGTLYIVGYTYGCFPATAGAYDTTYNDYGGADAFVLRFNASGSGPGYATYLGGGAHDFANGIALAASGTVYVSGSTLSGNFPTTFGAYDRTKAGTSSYYDCFLLKLDPTGSQLVYSTFLGGSDSEGCGSVAVASDGSLYTAGTTRSTDFPTTAGAFRPSYCGGFQDAFVAVLNPAGSALGFSTYIGGNLSDAGYELAIDGSGLLLLAGTTSSANFPTTPSAFQANKSGSDDLFVLGLSPSGDNVTFATFLGGNGSEQNVAMALAPNGHILLAGSTMSADLSTTPGAYLAYLPGRLSGLVAQLNGSGDSLDFLTYFGGGEMEWVGDLAVGADGEPLVVGYSLSTDLPTTANAIQPAVALAGYADAFLLKLAKDGSDARYLSYLGGNYTESGDVVTVDGVGGVYVAGQTSASDFPVTAGAYQTTLQNSTDLFIAKLAGPGIPRNLSLSGANGSVDLRWVTPASEGSASVEGYAVYRGDNASNLTLLTVLGPVLAFNDTQVVNGKEYYYALSARNVFSEGRLSPVFHAVAGLAPSMPTGFNATAGNRTATLVFSAPLDEGGLPVLGYRVFRGATPVSLVPRANLTPDVRNYTDTGLTNGMVYYYAVAAFNLVGEGPRAPTVIARPMTVPQAPFPLLAAWGDSAVDVDWPPPADDGGSVVLEYNVYRGATRDGLTRIATTPSLSYHDGGLTNGRAYYYAASAVNLAGEGPLTEPMAATPRGLPSAPLGLAAEGGAAQVSLRWSAPLEDGGVPILSYRLYRGDAPDALVPLSELAGTSLVDLGLTNGQTYHYAVAGVNEVGEGPRTGPVAATAGRFPAPPIAPTAASFGGTVVLDWQAPTDTGGFPILGYRIYRASAGSSVTPLEEVGLARNFTDATVMPGKSYDYRITAFNERGESPPSDRVSVLVRDEPPALLGTPPVEAPSVNLTSFQFSATDPDGPLPLTYALASGPFWITVSATGLLWIEPPAGVHGSITFSVEVRDGANASSSQTFRVAVGNRAPSIGAFGSYLSLRGEPGGFVEIPLGPFTQDADDLEPFLQWHVQGDLGGVARTKFDSTGRNLTVEFLAPGEASFTLFLTDSSGASDSRTLTVEVTAPAPPPTPPRSPGFESLSLFLALTAAWALMGVGARTRRPRA